MGKENFPPSLSAAASENSGAEINTPEYVVLIPSDKVTFSSETAASIASISVKEGSHFKSGQILVELDCRIQEADLQKALAQQQLAQAALKSAKKLKSYGAISEYEMIKAETESRANKADVARLSAIVDKCTIVAPFNGAVSELMVDTHDTVKPGDPLIKIVNTDNLNFEIQVPSSWLQWLHLDSSVLVHVNEINKAIPAKITKINPEIDSISQTIKITGTITPPNPTLLPGMSGQASFPDNPNNKREKTNHA
jgi:RND family efflux transporter MFP subunit